MLSSNYDLEVDLYLDTQSTGFDEMLLDYYGGLNIVSHNFHKEYLTQMGALDRALSYIRNNENFKEYSFILIIRFDLFFKDTFFELFKPNTEEVLFPSVCWYHHRKTIKGHPRINDVLFSIPQKYFKLCENFILPNDDIGHEFLNHWLPLIPDLKYSFILNTYHDSDTQKDWNPLYRIVNRPETSVWHSTPELKYPDNF
jgi:hypothetical protein